MNKLIFLKCMRNNIYIGKQNLSPHTMRMSYIFKLQHLSIYRWLSSSLACCKWISIRRVNNFNILKLYCNCKYLVSEWNNYCGICLVGKNSKWFGSFTPMHWTRSNIIVLHLEKLLHCQWPFGSLVLVLESFKPSKDDNWWDYPRQTDSDEKKLNSIP